MTTLIVDNSNLSTSSLVTDVLVGNEAFLHHIDFDLKFLGSDQIPLGIFRGEYCVSNVLLDRILKICQRPPLVGMVSHIVDCLDKDLVLPQDKEIVLSTFIRVRHYLKKRGVGSWNEIRVLFYPVGVFLPGDDSGVVALIRGDGSCPRPGCGFDRMMLRDDVYSKLSKIFVAGMHDAYHRMIEGKDLGEFNSDNMQLRLLSRLFMGLCILSPPQFDVCKAYRNACSFMGKIYVKHGAYEVSKDARIDNLIDTLKCEKMNDVMEGRLTQVLKEHILYPQELFDRKQLLKKRFAISDKIDGVMVLMGLDSTGRTMMYRNGKSYHLDGTFTHAVVICEEVGSELILIDVLESAGVCYRNLELYLRVDKMIDVQLELEDHGVDVRVQNYGAMTKRRQKFIQAIQKCRSRIQWHAVAHETDVHVITCLMRQFFDCDWPVINLLMEQVSRVADGKSGNCMGSDAPVKGMLCLDLTEFGGKEHFEPVLNSYLLAVFDLVTKTMCYYDCDLELEGTFISIINGDDYIGKIGYLRVRNRRPSDGFILTDLSSVNYLKVKFEYTVDFLVMDEGENSVLGLRQGGRVVSAVQVPIKLSKGKIVEMACKGKKWIFRRYREDKSVPNNMKMLRVGKNYVDFEEYMRNVTDIYGRSRR